MKIILTNAGSALMGIGQASGENRAVAAAKAAISSPLLEAAIDGARGILLNITGPSGLGLFEVNAAAEIIHGVAHQDANIIFGTVIDDEMGDEVQVTVIAAGFDRWEGAAGRRRRRTRRSLGRVGRGPGTRRLRRRGRRPARRRRRLRRAVVPEVTGPPATVRFRTPTWPGRTSASPRAPTATSTPTSCAPPVLAARWRAVADRPVVWLDEEHGTDVVVVDGDGAGDAPRRRRRS